MTNPEIEHDVEQLDAPLYPYEVIEMAADKPFRMSPDAMRALRKATGLTITDILTNEDEPETRMQALAFGHLFGQLARYGHLPDAATLWERAGRADIDLVPPDGFDPLGAEHSTTSQPSADSGE